MKRKKALTPLSIRPFQLAMLLLLPTTHAETSDAKEREAITETYSAWVETIAARDLEKWASYLDPGARFYPPDHRALTVRSEIVDHYAELFRDPLFALECELKNTEIAASGEVAWSDGICAATFTGPEGKEAHGHSKWVKVWKRQPSGVWKCAINVWNASGPSAD